ncbi:MAG: carbohydrate porin [Fusobacteria bacterium]|nr:carbohydrate porin [Fusobacteriota bacterium]
MKKLIIVAASVILAGAVLADSVGNGWEYHGYGRSGITQNTDFANPDMEGQDGSFSNAQGVQTGRLGNTNTTYIEVELVKDFQAQNGVWSKWHIMGAARTNNLSSWSPSTTYTENSNAPTENDIFLSQAYAEMGGFGWNPNVTIWAGMRYYDRNNIWATDYYVTDYSGTGFGVQGLLNGNLNLAYVGTSNGDQSYYAGTNIDNQLGSSLAGTTSNIIADYQLNQWGFQGNVKYNNWAQQVQIGYGDNGTIASASAAIWGGQVGVTYNQPTYYGLTNGWTQTILQYGQGLATEWALGSSQARIDDQTTALSNGCNSASPTDRTYQATTTGVSSFGNWQIQTVAGLLRDTPQYWQPTTSMNFVVTPMYNFTQNFALMFDMGYAYNWGANVNEGSGYLSTPFNGGIAQFTIAPTFTLSSDFFARPQIRPFVTYLIGNQNQIMLNGANHAFLFGAQAEVWF